MTRSKRFGNFPRTSFAGSRDATAFALFLFVLLTDQPQACGQTAKPLSTRTELSLSRSQWQRIDQASEKGLAYLASQQQPEGMFAADAAGQPAVTGLATLAFMAWGHEPGSGPYGDKLLQAVQFIVSQQRPNGMLTSQGPQGRHLHLENAKLPYSVPATYNHAISSLALCEVYGTVDTATSTTLRPVIERAIDVTLQMQRWPKPSQHAGGWRYMHSRDSDLSVTGWHLMFLRAAKNAGFEVPQSSIDQAVEFVRRCYHPQYQTFEYDLRARDRRTRAMAAAGILALAHAGQHHSDQAKHAADWILEHPFDRYNKPRHVSETYRGDRYHYGVFYCCQAMYQMGGHYWEDFFPATAQVLLDHQNPNGSWELERNQDMRFGRCYTTSLALLALGAPNQLLPIFQR